MLARTVTIGKSAGIVERSMDELALCRRIASGESHLFGRIVDEYSGLVASAIAAQGVDRSDIEDVAQAVMVSAYRGIAGFRGDAKLSSWLYRIAINAARAHLKKGARRLESHSVELAMESGQHPVDETRSAADGSAVRNRALGQAMDQLNDVQRTVLMLYYMDERSYEEISETLGININTVRTHIRRGKMKLAELLDETELLGD